MFTMSEVQSHWIFPHTRDSTSSRNYCDSGFRSVTVFLPSPQWLSFRVRERGRRGEGSSVPTQFRRVPVTLTDFELVSVLTERRTDHGRHIPLSSKNSIVSYRVISVNRVVRSLSRHYTHQWRNLISTYFFFSFTLVKSMFLGSWRKIFQNSKSKPSSALGTTYGTPQWSRETPWYR